jgi:hypothetical protein
MGQVHPQQRVGLVRVRPDPPERSLHQRLLIRGGMVVKVGVEARRQPPDAVEHVALLRGHVIVGASQRRAHRRDGHQRVRDRVVAQRPGQRHGQGQERDDAEAHERPSPGRQLEGEYRQTPEAEQREQEGPIRARQRRQAKRYPAQRGPYCPPVTLHPGEREQEGCLEEDVQRLGVQPPVPDEHASVDRREDARHERDAPAEEVLRQEVDERARPGPEHAAEQTDVDGLRAR